MTTDAVLITETNELSATPTPEPRKRGRKKSNIDSTVKIELDRATDRTRCSRYRARQRGERESLQQQVKALTEELTTRQQAENMSKELSTSTWKTIAQRELATRLIAETQQRQMCEAVETRAAFIRGFQEMIQLQDKVGNFVQRKKIRVEPSDAAFYKAFCKIWTLSTPRLIHASYQQEDRMVLVWQSIIEGEGMFTGMRAGETGWDVLAPSTDSTKPGTVLRICISHSPMQLGGETTLESMVKQFTGMILEMVAEDGVEIMKKFEKLHIC
ncbi:hypothetical protein GQ600_11908 [Phytophthora cactorum]|nr:hypothetical protein GQ600_11908 [Phytophthora cactorum]